MWLNKKWHRRTADGKLAILQKSKLSIMEKKGPRAAQENRSSSVQSRGAKQGRRSARESGESLSARRNHALRLTRALSKPSTHANNKGNKGWRQTAKSQARHAAGTERHVPPASHAPGPARTWKICNAGSYAGDTELLHQVCARAHSLRCWLACTPGVPLAWRGGALLALAWRAPAADGHLRNSMCSVLCQCACTGRSRSPTHPVPRAY